MAGQGRFHLNRSDSVAGAADDVVVASFEEEEAVLLAYKVSGVPWARHWSLFAVQSPYEQSRNGRGLNHELAVFYPRINSGKRPAIVMISAKTR